MAEAEGSDEASESELLDKSLSVWKGKSGVGKEKFEPIPLDLHTASSLGQYECVKNLITRGGIDFDKRNRGGWTALMYACYIGHDSIVNLLLEAGVSVNIRNLKGESPLMLAASCGNESVGFYLCQQGAELEAHDERGWTALFHATYSGHQNMVRFLLEQGANMNAVEKSMGMTPFMEAASEGHEIILQLFLQHGVNVNAKADNGDTARSLALINGNMKIVSLIDNHVMPITSLRAEAGLEADFSSSDDALSRNRHAQQRGPRGKTTRGRDGGPSILDGPAAIARLIDRTRHSDRDNFPDVIPKGYMTFDQAGGGDPVPHPQKLSFRDVTSPINPQDYTLDSSGGKESFENLDDTNAFSKTGALTIKSSSGSSGGLAAALGIRREDSLDSDEFPHDSSCDSRPHGDSGDSSSDDGGDEKSDDVDDVEHINDLVAAKCDIGEDASKDREKGSDKFKKGENKVKLKRGKENLTTDKVSEIEEVKNSVSEWIESISKTNTDAVTTDNVKTQENIGVAFSEGLDAGLCVNSEFELQNRNLYSQPIQFESNVGHHSLVQGNLPGNAQQATQYMTNVPPIDPHNFTENLTAGISERSLTTQNIIPNPIPIHHDSEKPVVINEHVIASQKHNQNVTSAQDTANPAIQTINWPSSQQGHDPVQGHCQVRDQGHQRSFPVQSATTPAPVSEFPASIPPPVSALNILNTDSSLVSSHHTAPTATTVPTTVAPHLVPAGNIYPVSAPGNYDNQQRLMQVPPPPGFQAPFNSYQMFPPGTATLQEGLRKENVYPSSKFMEKLKDAAADLPEMLEQLGLTKYLPIFEEQDVDLQVFLSLTDNDLKEIGIKLFGPRKKMMNAIARWHSKARPALGDLEQAYADRLEGEMQEMGVQLQMAMEEIEKLKAQVNQEGQLRNVTETCLMEERAAWQHVQRIIMDTRQQCEDFKDVLKKLRQYVNEAKARIPSQSTNQPIRGLAEAANERLPNDTVLRKLEYYMQESQLMLGKVTGNTDRLLGRNTSQSPDADFT